MSQKTRRHTPHKEAILAALTKQHALTANQIADQLPHINPSTIYRNLERFVVDGTVRTITLATDVTHYELAEDQHDHFVCADCHTVEAIHVPRDILKKVAPNGSRLQAGTTVISGYCAKCA